MKRIYSTKVLPEDQYFYILSIAWSGLLAKVWVRIVTAEVRLRLGSDVEKIVLDLTSSVNLATTMSPFPPPD